MKNQIRLFTRSARASGTLVSEQQKGYGSIADNQIDCTEDWLHNGDIADLSKVVGNRLGVVIQIRSDSRSI